MELEEESKPRDNFKQLKKEGEDCKYGGEDSECGCQFKYNNDKSERSYDGSDADNYYELKEEREERKQEKLQEQIDKV